MEINFISSKVNEKEHVMHSKSDNIKIMINDKVDETTSNSFFNHFFLDIPTWVRNINDR